MDKSLELLAFFNSKEFRAALKSVLEEPTRYSDFLRFPMPEGYSHAEIWSIILALQKELGQTSKVKPWFKNLGKDEVWYYVPKTTLRDLDSLSSIAATQSHLNRYVRRNEKNDQGLLPAVWEEIASLARRDGLPVTEREIKELWLGNSRAANAAEQVIVNLSTAFYDIKKLVHNNYFSRVLITNIHEMIVHGVGELELIRQPYFSVNLAEQARLTSPEYVSETLDAIVQTVRSISTMQDIIIEANEISYCLWDIPYVPSLRCLTEFLIRRAYFLLQDLPAFSYFPFSSKIEQLNGPYVQTHESENTADGQEGINSTWIYAGGVKAYLESARDMIATIEQLETESNNITARIENMASLNARQKVFAINASQNPTKAYKVQDYIAMHDIAYATARQDLLALVNMGLLSMRKDGKAFVFQAVTQ